MSIQRNAFWAISGNAVRRVSDWHTNCFEKVRKEQGNENQNEFEGWFCRGQTDREHKLFVRQSGVLTSVGRRGFREEETMKTKTNVKAGIGSATTGAGTGK
jgi:hypothetical protein